MSTHTQKWILRNTGSAPTNRILVGTSDIYKIAQEIMVSPERSKPSKENDAFKIFNGENKKTYEKLFNSCSEIISESKLSQICLICRFFYDITDPISKE